MERRHLIAGGAAGAATGLAAPRLASAQPQVLWRFPGSFPKSLETLYGTHEFVARRVGELSGGAFQLRPFGPGELIPALQVLDGVGAGTVECGFTSGYYYAGKDPSLALATTLPFGLNSRQQWSWWHFGGGREAMTEVYRDQGVVALPMCQTGAQMGGWFKREIRAVEDLRGIKMRVAGFAGNALGKLGVIPQLLGGADIYPALERGVLDAAEWVAPYDDERLGFQRIAPFYYYPGWWEPGPQIDMVVNLRAWEALPAQYRAILEAACSEGYLWSAARYDMLNPPALRRLIAGGTQLKPFPREVLQACYRASQELWGELGAQNARFRRIHEGWDRFRQDEQAWFRVAEDSIASFLAVNQRG